MFVCLLTLLYENKLILIYDSPPDLVCMCHCPAIFMNGRRGLSSLSALAERAADTPSTSSSKVDDDATDNDEEKDQQTNKPQKLIGSGGTKE